MRRVARRLRSTCLKQIVEPGARALPIFGKGNGDRYDRVEHYASDALGVVTHVLLCQISTIRHTHNVPMANTERGAEIGEIGRVLSGVVRGQIGRASCRERV